MEVIKYESFELNDIVNRIPSRIRDDLPFGMVKLDLLGNILEYNMAEAALTGFRPEDVIGKNFFLDVATCTQTPEFYGKFREGVVAGLVNIQFDYMFDREMSPTMVRVRMVQMKNVVWLLIKRLNQSGEIVDIERAPTYVPATAPLAYLDSLLVQPARHVSAPPLLPPPPPPPVPPPPPPPPPPPTPAGRQLGADGLESFEF